MNLDDLMEVWRSQDAAPLHGVNETLLRLALRQDEAKLQAQRRRERWIIYVIERGSCRRHGGFLRDDVRMLFYNDDDVITGWDFVIPIVGAAAALLVGVALYVSRRAQALREQRFGESLRDQLDRRIAQLDYGRRQPACAGQCAAVGDLSDSHPRPRLSDQRQVDQRRRLYARHADLHLVWSVAGSVWWLRREERKRCRTSTGWRRC